VEYVVMEYAFPIPVHTEDGHYLYTEDGMTLRDYFAGQALAGILSNNSAYSDPETHARLAYSHADAMLKARGGG
jgi:hypothetical protein